MDGYNNYEQTEQIPSQYKPISAWGYVGYNLLFSIPLIGFILIIVFAVGGSENINVRNYARSFLCVLLLSVILAAIVVLIMIIAGGSFAYYMRSI